MEDRLIQVSVDTFALIWAARIPGERNEDQILSRLLSRSQATQPKRVPEAVRETAEEGLGDLPASKKWTDLLAWTLKRHGGRATLSEIYKTSRRGRMALGYSTTPHHDDSARECLDSHCRKSTKFKGTELFHHARGKGRGHLGIG